MRKMYLYRSLSTGSHWKYYEHRRAADQCVSAILILSSCKLQHRSQHLGQYIILVAERYRALSGDVAAPVAVHLKSKMVM